MVPDAPDAMAIWSENQLNSRGGLARGSCVDRPSHSLRELSPVIEMTSWYCSTWFKLVKGRHDRMRITDVGLD